MTFKNIIHFDKRHALYLGDDFEYISTFIESNKLQTVENYRLLLRGVESGKEIFLHIADHPYKGSYLVNLAYIERGIGTANYQDIGSSNQHVHEVLSWWKENCKFITLCTETWMKKELVTGYKWAYKFENIEYK